MMEPIYWAISWILLRWHSLWDVLLPGAGGFLGTTWPWILAIVFLVITVRIILFPIFVKQIRSQRAMQALQPKMKEIQTKYKGDQAKLREETTKLFQQEKVNPLMGCLPMFLQIPVFLGLFHILQRLDPVQTVNTTLYGWTQGQWDSAAIARLFNAPIAARFADGGKQLDILDANGLTVKVVAGVLVLVMMFTTYLTSRQMILKTGWNPDPQQRMIQKLMLYGIPFSLLLSGWYFPIGVIVYWVTQNLISFAQQHWVLHKYPPPVAAGAVPATGGNIFGRIPVAGETAGPAKSAPPDRPIPKAKPSAGSALVNPVQPEKEKKAKTGLFGRKAEPAPTVVETRSLAPKPGAKPSKPAVGPSGSAAVDGSAGTNGSANTSRSDSRGVQKPAGTQSSASKASKAGGSSGAAKNGSKAGTAKSGTPKKGQPSRKGGPRR
jgi:YidC/Oxa1 family membrane protein insertase